MASKTGSAVVTVQADVHLEADGTGSPLHVKCLPAEKSCAQQTSMSRFRDLQDDFDAIQPLYDTAPVEPPNKVRRLHETMTTTATESPPVRTSTPHSRSTTPSSTVSDIERPPKKVQRKLHETVKASKIRTPVQIPSSQSCSSTPSRTISNKVCRCVNCYCYGLLTYS